MLRLPKFQVQRPTTAAAAAAILAEHGENALIQCIHGAHIAATHPSKQEQHDYCKTIDALVQNGVAVNQTDKQGRTALHWCAQYALHGLAQELLLRDADASVEDSFGYKPLHLAILNRVDGCVQTIAEQRPKVEAHDVSSVYCIFSMFECVGFRFSMRATLWEHPRSCTPFG